MEDLRFDWDPAKSTANLRKHKVGFEEAATAFLDAHALLIDDPEHSAEEDRFILMGLSGTLRLLLVCHCYREKAASIRIISARKADRLERTLYFARFKP
ncbi:MAG: BrnT family toxin [Holophagaceae bacterium]|nr:BrnT family toxin [Acidobacteriota bacterium]